MVYKLSDIFLLIPQNNQKLYMPVNLIIKSISSPPFQTYMRTAGIIKNTMLYEERKFKGDYVN